MGGSGEADQWDAGFWARVSGVFVGTVGGRAHASVSAALCRRHMPRPAGTDAAGGAVARGRVDLYPLWILFIFFTPRYPLWITSGVYEGIGGDVAADGLVPAVGTLRFRQKRNAVFSFSASSNADKP